MVLHITQQQEGGIRNLVRKRCANYRKGNCLLLHGLKERTCVQLLCRSGASPGERLVHANLEAKQQGGMNTKAINGNHRKPTQETEDTMLAFLDAFDGE